MNNIESRDIDIEGGNLNDVLGATSDIWRSIKGRVDLTLYTPMQFLLCGTENGIRVRGICWKLSAIAKRSSNGQ